MNLQKVYVTKIYKETKIPKSFNGARELVVDTTCYGDKKTQTTIVVSDSEYKMIKEKGYYLA